MTFLKTIRFNIVACLALAVMLSISTPLAGVSYDPVDFTVSIPMQTVAVTNVNGKAVFNCDNYMYLAGYPKMPLQSVTFLLPEDADLSTVQVNDNNLVVENLAGAWEVDPAGPYLLGEEDTMWPLGANIVDGKNIDVYKTNAYLPSSFYGNLKTGKMRRFKVATVQIVPYRYNPVKEALQRVTGGTITLTFNKDMNYVPFKNRKALSAPEVKALFYLKEEAENFQTIYSRGMFEAYYPSFKDDLVPAIMQAPKLEPLLEPPYVPLRTYVILTTNYITSDFSNSSKKLIPFIASKEGRFFDVTLVTENKTYKRNDNKLTLVANEGWGGGEGQPAAENIRSWLKGNVNGLERWEAWEIEYLLLIGCPDPTYGTVPMKATYPCYEITEPGDPFHLDKAPTDYYYAELTSDWTSSEPGYDGTLNNSFDLAFDLSAEISVGRIPVAGFGCEVAELDDILSKIMAYTDASESSIGWRKNVLLPMKPTHNHLPNWPVGETIKAICQLKNFGVYRIYDIISGPQIDYEFYIKKTQAVEAGLINEAQAEQLTIVFEAIKAGFPEDPWYSKPGNWQSVVNMFPILNLDYNSAFTNAPADDDPYNDAGNPAAFNESIVRAAWTKDPYGLVIWKTHGTDSAAQYVYDIDTDPLYPPLDDDHPSFVFMESCFNGYPNNSWNLGYSLAYSILLKGGVGTMAASAMSLAGDASRLSDTWSFLFIDGELTNSDALNATIVYTQAVKMDYNFLVYNPYGDPSVGIYTCEPQ